MWLLIDGNNWFARDYFAAEYHATRNFLTRLADVRADRRPNRVAVCWDSRSFRHDLDPSYKAGRGDKPEGFNAALADCRDRVAALAGVHSFAVPGFEADDLLATLAAAAIDEGERATIFSSDRDLHQCLTDGWINQVTRVLREAPGKIAYEFLTAKTFSDAYRVAPHQWVDFRAIVGDKSDGIKGCPGLGPKVALAVLSRFDSLDEFWDRPFEPSISNRERALLLNFRDKLPAARRLLTLRRDAPLPATWLESIPL